MENIKSNFGTLDDDDGRYDIVLYDKEPEKLNSFRKYEMRNIELTFDGSICTITGEKRKYDHYDFDISMDTALDETKFTKEELEKVFDKRDIKYKKKIIRNWFKKDEESEVPYLSGWVRFNEYIPIKITTPCWALYDKRAKPVVSAEAITDTSGMD